jgi:acid phosphatase type 7
MTRSPTGGPRDLEGRRRFVGRGTGPALAATLTLVLLVACSPVVAAPHTGSSAPHTGPSAVSIGAPGDTVVAYVTDYGNCDEGQQEVADLVDSWTPAAVVTGGDNTQGEEDCVPFEQSVDDYYGEYYSDPENPRFFPALGNHEYENETAGLAAFARSFPYLPRDADPHGRWYSATIGSVAFFLLDTDAPAGDQTAQRAWLERSLDEARATRPDLWRVVVAHRPPYSSGVHGPWEPMQPEAGWRLAEWGADLVLSGHQHVYEDVVVDGLHHITGTTGAGETVRRCGEVRVVGSRTCLEGPGALRISASTTRLVIELHLLGEDAARDRVVLSR